MNSLDLRELIPAERHKTVFKTFDALNAGGTFEIVVDHNPMGLYSQFKTERTGQFEWNYNENGPSVWRVSVTKVAKDSAGGKKEEGCCGGCGGR